MYQQFFAGVGIDFSVKNNTDFTKELTTCKTSELPYNDEKLKILYQVK